MKDLLLQYSYIFYIIEGLLIIVRTNLNETIYKKMDHEDMWDSSAFGQRNFTGGIMVFFTLWWPEYKTEEDIAIRKLMIQSNKLSIVFAVYTVLVCVLFLYKFNQVEH